MTKLALAATLLGACSSAKTPQPAMPTATATCSDLACLDANEGKVIDVEGTFVFPPDPKRKGQHLYRLTLADGTSMVLHAKHAKLTADIDGKRITARGVYYKHPMPERYGIIQAVADPYLVELYDVVVR
ncbi:MAG: hypothetical protein M4D80_02585 [Myxococcota bacterium]|nr:hypothetical protein [Myxococcota bacterium]